MVCKKCGRPVRDSDRFCMSCGASLEEQRKEINVKSENKTTQPTKNNIQSKTEKVTLKNNKKPKKLLDKNIFKDRRLIIIIIEIIIIIIISIISFIMLTKPKSDNINKYNELIYKWSCNSGETYLHFKNGTEYEWYMDDKNYYDINGTYTVKKDSDIYYITLNSKNRVTYGHKYTNTYQANYMLIFRGKYEFELKNVNINKTFQCKREN